MSERQVRASFAGQSITHGEPGTRVMGDAPGTASRWAALTPLEQVINALPCPAWLYAPDTLHMLAGNEPASSLFGYQPEQFIALDVTELYAEDEVARYLIHVERELEGRAHEGRWRQRARDGRIIEARVRTTPIRIADRLLSLAVVDPGDGAEAAADAPARSNLEAVGLLASGIAHDFNNQLMAIGWCARLLTEGLEPGSTLYEHAEQICRAAEQASSLTQQLLAFNRRHATAPKVIDLNRVVVEMEKLLQRVIGEDIKLMCSLDPAAGYIRADRAQVERVVMNLAANARDAMPVGGQLTIETVGVQVEARDATRHRSLAPGSYVLLAVSDTGIGMDEATQARIFEPFFTTKEAGRGTGLGLATVLGVVKQAGGHIEVHSRPGEGTTVSIYYPRAADCPEERHEPVAAVPARGSETILLVEDERAVRALVRIALHGFGYRVLEAATGDDALRICEEYPGRIDLLLTDVVMPGLSGRRVAERIARMRPGMPTVYMSGYADDAVVRHGVQEDQVDFIQKPFTPDELVARIREALDRRDAGR